MATRPKPASAQPGNAKTAVPAAAASTAAAPAAKAAVAAVPKSPAKVAVKAAVKPPVKKPAAKPAPKAAVGTAPKLAAKPAPKPTPKAAGGAAAKKVADKPAAKTVKPKKAKMVRDSFTMPESEYELIAAVKKRCIAKGAAVKKSEVLRAAVIGFAAQSDAAVMAALRALAAIKTGRPPKGQK